MVAEELIGPPALNRAAATVQRAYRGWRARVAWKWIKRRELLDLESLLESGDLQNQLDYDLDDASKHQIRSAAYSVKYAIHREKCDNSARVTKWSDASKVWQSKLKVLVASFA